MFEESTVFVVDDDSMARASVCALVDSMGIKTQAFTSAEELLEAIAAESRGCIVSDLRMVGMSGLELLATLQEREIPIPVILITAHPRTSTTVQAIQKGAVTLLEKPYPEDQLWDAVRKALRQGDLKLKEQEQTRAIMRRMASLSDKERQVMDLMVAGHANKVIAKKLGVSIRTVETRRHDVFEKTSARSLPDLVRMVMMLPS